MPLTMKLALIFPAVLCLLQFPHLSQAEAPAPPPLTSPAALPSAFDRAVAKSAKSIEDLNGKLEAEAGRLAANREKLRDSHIQDASLRALLAVQRLAMPQVGDLLKTFSLQKQELESSITGINGEIKSLSEDAETAKASLESLSREAKYLAGLGSQTIWPAETQKAYQAYTSSASRELDLLHALLERKQEHLKILAEQKALVDGLIMDLQALADANRIKFLNLREHIPIKDQLLRGLEMVSTLPALTHAWLVNRVLSPAGWHTLRPYIVPLFGLALLLALWGRAWRRLDGKLQTNLLDEEKKIVDMHIRSQLHFVRIVASHLFLAGFVLWSVLAIHILGLAHSAPTLVLFSLPIAAGVLRFLLHLVHDLFSPRKSDAMLPVPDETRTYYRRTLKVFSCYLVIGITGFFIADLAGIRNATVHALQHMFELGILSGTLLLLRNPHATRLLAVFPLPPRIQSARTLRALQAILVLLIAVAVFASIFQFYPLAFYTTGRAVKVEGIVFLFVVLMLAGREMLHVLLHPGHGVVGSERPERAKLLLRLSALIRSLGAVIFGFGLIFGIAWALGESSRLWDMVTLVLTWKISLGTVQFTPLSIILAAAVLSLVKWFSRFSRTLLRLHVFPRTLWDPGIQYTVSTILQYLIFIVGVILALSVIGFPMANIVLITGALGLGVGLGLQSVVSNFVSGLILLIERPIKVGDMLVVDGQWGEVKEIRIRTTVFQTFDRYVLIIPNSELTAKQITNWTHYGKGVNRLNLKVGVAYGSDLKMVTRVLNEVCAANPRIMSAPPPQVYFEAYGESALNFTIQVFVRTPDDRTPATHELNSAMFEEFRKNGIEIPFPQRDIHLRDMHEKQPPESIGRMQVHRGENGDSARV